MSNIHRIFYQRMKMILGQRSVSPGRTIEGPVTIYIDVEAYVDLNEIIALRRVNTADQNAAKVLLYVKTHTIEFEEMPLSTYQSLYEAWIGWKTSGAATKEWRSESSNKLWEDL